jgi:dipeptidyl-peptidase-3
VYNFDHKNPPTSPITQKPITSYYKPGETWGSVFGGMGPSYEECRAESVAMSLVSSRSGESDGVKVADLYPDSGL